MNDIEQIVTDKRIEELISVIEKQNPNSWLQVAFRFDLLHALRELQERRRQA